MSTAIVRTLSPEEQEYARYLLKIEERKQQVAELRAEVESTKLLLGRFEAEYHVRVGVLFVELDRVRLAIDEYEQRIAILKFDPEKTAEKIEQEINEHFTRQREEVRSEEEETKRYEQAHRREQELPKLDHEAEQRAKRLYRELAKRFHPDLGRTEEERRQRETVMQRVNVAYQIRDLTTLEAMSAEAEVTDEAFEARSIGEKLVWAIREVARLEEVRITLESESDALLQTETYRLWSRQNLGDAVIERLENELNIDISRLRRRLALLIGTYREKLDGRG